MNTFTIEKFVRNMANSIGIDIKRLKKGDSEFSRVVCMLKTNGIQQVLDIGANEGQYAKNLRLHGFTGNIISFEPLTNAWRTISDASKNDPKWNVYNRCAIGSKNELSSINISRNSVSSSLLNMLESHKSAAPSSEFISKEPVQIITLDSIYDELQLENKHYFIKIDTQGFEDEVIKGGSRTFKGAKGMQIELSFTPLYSGQKLFFETLENLRSIGFELWSIFPGFTDHSKGRMMQVDAVLFKEK